MTVAELRFLESVPSGLLGLAHSNEELAKEVHALNENLTKLITLLTEKK